MSSEPALLEVRDAVATLTLDTPERGNGIDGAMGRALLNAAKRIESDGTVRAVLLKANGRNFSVGGDIVSMAENAHRLPELIASTIGVAHDAILRLASLPVPVVCALQGAAAGGGLGLALTSDYIVAEEGARFRAAHSALGFAGDCGISWLLPRAVGGRRARNLVLTNRVIDAATALDWGLVEQVVPAAKLQEEALAIARNFAQGPTQGFAAAKRLQLATLMPGLAAQLELERIEMAKTAETADPAEALRAFLEKRPAKYRGR